MRNDKPINLLLESFFKHFELGYCTQDELGTCDLCIGYTRKLKQLTEKYSYLNNGGQPELIGESNKGSEKPF
jgi:hypothetical protein